MARKPKTSNRGRPRKPTVVKAAMGNPGRRTLNEREPSTPVIDISTPAPEVIAGDPDALECWAYHVRILEKWRILQKADREILTSYCMQYSIRQKAFRSLEYGIFLKAPSGYVQQAPGVSLAMKAGKEMALLGSQLGFSPSARAGLELPESDEEAAAASDFGG